MKIYFILWGAIFLLFSCSTDSNRQNIARDKNITKNELAKSNVKKNNTQNKNISVKVSNLESQILKLEKRIDLLEKRYATHERIRNKSISWAKYIILIAIGFLLFNYRKYLKSPLKSIFNNEKTKQRSRKNKEKSPQYKTRQRKNKIEHSQIARKSTTIEKKDNYLEKETTYPPSKNNIHNTEKTVNNKLSNEGDENWDVENKMDPEVFYLPSPSAEGDFDSFYATPYMKKGFSLYKCKYINNTKTKAEFELIRDPEVEERAISAIDYLLYPACDDYGTYSKGLRLVRKKQGIIELCDERWYVIKKAIIEFI